jgi:predicted nucleic-acid-binding protein
MKKHPAFPDTNFILRYLLRDNEAHFTTANDFFEKVRTGRQSVLIAEAVLVESLYVLTKYYAVSRPDAAKSLSGLFHYKGVTNLDKESLLKGLELFATTALDPVDCILAARSIVDGVTVMTFDKALKKACK